MHTYHSNATTNIHVRQLLKDNLEAQSCRAQAARFGISIATVHKWRCRKHHHLMDASSKPRQIHCAFTDAEQLLIVHLRQSARLSLDDLLAAVEPVIPHASRSSLYRLLVRKGLQRLPRLDAERTDHNRFEAACDQMPGFLHIDNFQLTCLPGQSNKPAARHHCFVAVDRATRMVFLRVYTNRSGASACAFLEQCVAFFPFRAHTVLTDNGGEFTIKAVAPVKFYKRSGRAAFEHLCHSLGIAHKTTRPYTPKTNGMVERVNGLIQQATTKRHRYPDQQSRDTALHAWLEHYNFTRKHSRIPIGRMTPFDAACHWHALKPELFARGQPKQTTLRTIILNQERS